MSQHRSVQITVEDQQTSIYPSLEGSSLLLSKLVPRILEQTGGLSTVTY